VRRNLILCGVGGQGLLSLAAVIGDAAIRSGLRVKQAEVHGMAQRGGAVQSHLRLSDKGLHADLVERGTADLVVSLEPMEALRYVEYLSPRGVVLTARTTVENVSRYPDAAALDGELAAVSAVVIDAVALAKEAGTARCANMVMAGVASPWIGLEEAALEAAIERLFASKGRSVVDVNLSGFRRGAEEGKRLHAATAEAV